MDSASTPRYKLLTMLEKLVTILFSCLVSNADEFFRYVNGNSGMQYANEYAEKHAPPDYDWRNFNGITNPNFWQVQGIPFFLKNPMVKPSNAIQAFIQGTTICDCGNAIQAFMYVQLLTDLGAKKFDAVFGHINLHVMITQFVMQPIPSDVPQKRDQAPSGNPLYFLYDYVDGLELQDLRDGDIVYIKSTKRYVDKHLQGFYPGENLVVVMSDTEPRFIGFGSNFKDGPLTYAEIVHYLIHEYNKPQTPRICALIATMCDNPSDPLKQSEATLARILQDDQLPYDPSSIDGLMHVIRPNPRKVAKFVGKMLTEDAWYYLDRVVDSKVNVEPVLLTPIPSENANSTFENYVTDGDPQREHLLTVFRRFVTASTTSSIHPIALIVTGKAGVGKTHLSIAALTEIAKFGKKVLFVNESFLTSMYQSSGGKFFDSSVLAIADLVVLDDLNSEYGSAIDFFKAAVRHVFINNKSIIITSNNDKIASKFSQVMPFHMAYNSPAIKNTLHIQVDLPSFRVPWTITTSKSGGGSKESKVCIFTKLKAYSGNTSAGIIIRTKPINFELFKVYEVGAPYNSNGKLHDLYCEKEPNPFTADVYVFNLPSVERKYMEQFVFLVDRIYARGKRVVVIAGPHVKSLKIIVDNLMTLLTYGSWTSKKMMILDRVKTMFPQLKF